MSSRQICTIVILILILSVMGIAYYAYRRIRNKIRDFSKTLLGTEDIMKGLQQIDRQAQVTPKSVSSATSIYLPNIVKDFPEFHYEEMKGRAENVLTSYLRSIDEGNPALLKEGLQELVNELEMKIDMLRGQGMTEHFHNIKVHRTELKAYRKIKGRCSIVFQSAVQYQHYLEKDGGVVQGSQDKLCQTRYETEMIYIQDREQVENAGTEGAGLVCPNCGAPLPMLGAKKCEYCDSPVVEFNIRTWNFSSVKEKV